MYPPVFEYISASSLPETLDLLVTHGAEAKVLAGGQSLIPLMKLRLVRPTMLIDINGLKELRYIKRDSEGLAIGALTRLADIEAAQLEPGYEILKDSVKVIADPQVRHLGTIGGNCAHGDPGNDLPAVLIALNAVYRLQSKRGTREVAARDFYHAPFETALRPTELLTEIRIPRWGVKSSGAYVKLKRRVGDYAIAAVAVQVELSENGIIRRAGIAYTNLGPTPIAGDAVAHAIEGERGLDDALATAEGAVAKVGLKPSSDLRGPDWYKLEMAKVLTVRALKTAIQRAMER